MTLPAPIVTFSPIQMGAINKELLPIKESFFTIVLFFFLPSKLQVIVPAPILTFSNISESPIYERCAIFTFLLILDFLIST